MLLITVFFLGQIKKVEGENIGLSEKPSTQFSQQNNESFFSFHDAPETAFYPATRNTYSQTEKRRIEAHIREVFGEDNGEIAIAIAKCESGLDSAAINYSDADITGNPSWGIFQINRPEFEGWDDWKKNIDIAYNDFYLIRKFQPWSCYTKGLYKKYL